MKRIFCAMLALALLLVGLAAAGEGGERLQLMKCPEQDFVTACREGLEWSWMDDGTGLNLWLEGKGSIPYLLIWRNREGSADAEAFFRDVFTPGMRADYGDRLIDAGAFQTYTVQGVQLYGQQYTYLVGDIPVVLLRLMDTRFGGSVSYTAKYRQDDPEATLEALAIAVNFYRDSADGYDGPAPVPSDGGTSPGGKTITATPTEPIVAGTTTYSDGRFTMEIPEGWKLMTAGTLAQDLCVRVWDPQRPERCIFRAGKLQPFLRSPQAKAFYGQLAGLDLEYALFADAPALEELTLDCFLAHEDEMREYGKKYAYTGMMLDYEVFPALRDVEVLQRFPSQKPCPPTCYDNAVARIAFNSESGEACEGMVTAQPTRIGASLYMSGVDVNPDIVYDFMGFLAPQGELIELEGVLNRCLGSFTFDEEFIRQSLQAAEDEAEIVRQMAAGMQAACDSCNAAWESRQTSYDILSQQRSDATLGYERLYDSETGEVYRAESGFWDDYSLDPNAYSNPNLRIIDDASRDYYLRGVDYTITR